MSPDFCNTTAYQLYISDQILITPNPCNFFSVTNINNKASDLQLGLDKLSGTSPKESCVSKLTLKYFS